MLFAIFIGVMLDALFDAIAIAAFTGTVLIWAAILAA